MRTLLLFTLLLTLLPAPAMPATTADKPDLDVMIGQMLLVGFRGTDAPDNSAIAREITRLHLGGVVLFDYDVALKQRGRNITSPDQLKALTTRLQSMANIPLIIGVDQEGGRVQRLKARTGFRETPSPQELGAVAGTHAAAAAGATVGRQLREMGVNVNFAPVLDVNLNPQNPVIGALGRSFSSDPSRVAELGTAFLEGMEKQDVLGAVKHFPGHGSAAEDSHLGLPDVTGLWHRAELAPFKVAISRGSAKMVMTAHLFNAEWDSEHPATLSKNVITGMLRNELGFDGVVVTDDLNMGAIAERYGLERAIFLAVDAGCDVLLFGNNLRYDPDIAGKAHAILKALVLGGEIKEARIRASFDRIMRIKKELLDTR